MKRKALSFLLVFTIALGILNPMAAALNETTDWETEFSQETLESPVGDDFNSNDSPQENSDEETETEPSSDSIAPLSTDIPLLTGLTIRTSTSTANWSNALLAGEANDSGLEVFSPDKTTYTLPDLTDSTTQLRFWFNKSADVSSVVLYWGEQSKEFTTTSTQWANCLSPGRNTIRLVVTPSEGDAVVYAFTVDVLPSLTALSLSSGGSPVYLDKTFGAGTKEYTAKIPSTASELTVSATPKGEYSLNYNGEASNVVDISEASALTVTVSVGEVSSTYTVTLNKVPSYTASVSASPSDAAVMIYDAQGAVLARGLGSASANGVTEAKYVVSKNGYITQTGNIPDESPVSVTLAKAPEVELPDYTGAWTSFRGNPEHMGITTAKTPASPEEATLKWAQKYGSGWSAAPTPPLILNDALYIAVANKVLKIDKATGETLQESEALVGNVGFAMNPIAYGDGMFFVPIGQGRIQALRADTLESLWVSENLGSLAQTVSPLVYHDGYLYTGVWNKESDPGTYFCLSVTDEDPSQKTETKLCTWKFTHTAGFYWAGAYVTDDYLIVGSDDGLPEGTYENKAVLFSLDPKTGAVLDRLTEIKGDIRSSISYDKDSGKVFFASKGGWFCTVKVNEDGTFDTSSFRYVDLEGMCTGTPLVYNSRAYIGSSGAQGQFGPGKLNVIDLSGETPVLAYYAELPGYPQASALLTSAYGDTAYVYITYNNNPGGIYAIEDKAGQTTAKGYHLFIPGSGMQQYAIASLVADADGTIYYKNDSCYLMGVSRNTAYLTGLSADKGILNKAFAGGTLDYELVVPVNTESVTLVATPSEGASVTINGESPAPVTLADGKATATIVVTKASDTRTYTVAIREISTDATLSNASANLSNTLGGGQVFDLSAGQNSFTWTNSDKSNFRRIWIKPADAKATVTATVVSGVSTSTDGTALAEGTTLEGIAGTGTGVGYTRYNVYFAANCAEATIKVTVTAEDGVTAKDYFFTVTRPDTYAPILSDGTGTRTGADKGNVSFTSSKAGSYYYQIVESGAAEPNLDTSGTGIVLDAPGRVTISLTGLTAGAKDVYVKVKDTAGNVSAVLKIALPAEESTGGGSTPKETITVSFRLIGSTLSIGDVDLENGDYKGAVYQTWIKTARHKLDKDASVYDLFTLVLDEAGLQYEGAENNYVHTIYAPDVLGSYELSEFTNGPRSGWMYTVNGTHPGFGLKEWTLEDGDVVIWHYVNDYSHEVADWFDDDPRYPSLGDGSFHNKWLSAPDVAPSAGQIPGGNPGGGSGGNAQEPETIIKPSVQIDKNGQAKVSIDKDSMKEVVDQAMKDASATIVIAPEIRGTASKVLVDVPSASLSAISSNTVANLTVETPIGSITIPNDALGAIAKQTTGSTVTISFGEVNPADLTPEQSAAAGSKTVYDISLLSGGKYISDFGGMSITISLPYALKAGENADDVTVWYLSDEGKLERIRCKYDAKTGLATFTTPHLSNYVVGLDSWPNPFTDVKAGDWFYTAVKFVSREELFNGTSKTQFSPNAEMTRAMLVTVLYRLEGMPAVKGANAFKDVAPGEWYTDAVLWATENGIVTGYGNGLFGTHDAITREQMAAMLYRYAQFKKYDTRKTNNLTGFSDSGSIASYALTAIKWANAEELITGRTSTTLAPKGIATRAEVSAILMRFTMNLGINAKS